LYSPWPEDSRHVPARVFPHGGDEVGQLQLAHGAQGGLGGDPDRVRIDLVIAKIASAGSFPVNLFHQVEERGFLDLVVLYQAQRDGELRFQPAGEEYAFEGRTKLCN